MSLLELDAHLQKHLPSENPFDALMNFSGVEHRHVKHRRTIECEIGGKRYFIKAHRGCGWREIFKDIFQLRAPVISAENEWRAIEQLQRLGVNTLKIAGKGLRGKSPAQRESFLVTEAMDGMINLEHFPKSFHGIAGQKQILLKRAFLNEIARIARILHENGMNHRDFYLCHFLVKNRDWSQWQPGDELKLVLIDLHRVQFRSRVPERWLIKDLGGLLFSALDAELTRNDLFRFANIYRQRRLRKIISNERNFWKKVFANARKLYHGFHKKEPPPVSNL
jgi:heptose I phosphotransferase